MKLEKILHPEIVLGTRGDKALIKLYRDSMQEMDDYFYHRKDATGQMTYDINVGDHFRMCTMFAQERPGVYHVGKAFAQAIGKLDREIPVDLLPARWFGYISFPRAAVYDEDEEVQGAYVYIGPYADVVGPNFDFGKKDVMPEDKVFWVTYVNKDSGDVAFGMKESGQMVNLGPVMSNIGRLLCPLRKEKLSAILETVPVVNVDVPKQHTTESAEVERSNVWRLLLNLTLYINSIDADLVPMPDHSHLSNKVRKAKKAEGKLNECTVPVMFVSWNYQKPRQFTKDEVWIDTFMRWQRCGPGLTQVKLVWVSAHERKLNKESEVANVSG